MTSIQYRLTSSIVACCLLALALAPAAAAQEPTFIDNADFDRPESWALKYFTSASLLTSLGPVESREPGSIEVAFEAIHLPSLSAEERTVGFRGRKEEDLNRSPVSGRLRLMFGLPAKFTLTLGYAPPVEVDGLEAELFNIALERPIWEGPRGSFGLRVHAQEGDANGDLVCSDADAAFPPGSPNNEFGCRGASMDDVSIDYVAFELNAALDLSDRTTLYGGISTQEMDLSFQVDAMTFGFHDRTLILTDGSTWSLNAGLSFDFRAKSRFAIEAFYTPLDVVRPGSEAPRTEDLINLRGLFSYRLR